MLDEIKISFLNGWNLKCTFLEGESTHKVYLGVEIYDRPSTFSEDVFTNSFHRSSIDYQSVFTTVIKLKDTIINFFLNEDVLYVITDDSSVQFKYLLYSLQQDIFGIALNNKYELEMSFRLNGQEPIGCVNDRNIYILGDFNYSVLYNKHTVSNLKQDNDLCFDFTLKIKL
jgi:hypothetical protein